MRVDDRPAASSPNHRRGRAAFACVVARRARERVGGDARREGEGIGLRQQADVARGRHVSLRDAIGSVFVFQRARTTARAGVGVDARRSPTPAGFPRVDPETQKGRDDVRRKVLADELAAEEKLLTESRVPTRTARPRRCRRSSADAEKYRMRIARLRQW